MQDFCPLWFCQGVHSTLHKMHLIIENGANKEETMEAAGSYTEFATQQEQTFM